MIWNRRYAARHNVLQGRSDGTGWILADTIARDILVERNRLRDAAVPQLPEWKPEETKYVQEYLTRETDPCVASLSDLCDCGPSIRMLWSEAKQQGLPDLEAFLYIVKWAHHRPVVWDQDDLRKKRGSPKSDPKVSSRLKKPMEWHRAEDLSIPWTSESEGEIWQIRLNDYPDEWMYSTACV